MTHVEKLIQFTPINYLQDLLTFVLVNDVRPDPDFSFYNSAVYAVVDCVFSARAKYRTIVVPIITERLPVRLPDLPDLSLSAFVDDIDSFGEDKFERYAEEVIKNRQKIGKHLKIRVAYEVCTYLVSYADDTVSRLQRISDFHSIQKPTSSLLVPDPLERLILNESTANVYGIGPVLARYLMWLLGREDHVKPDTMLLRLFSRLGEWKPRSNHLEDMEIIRQAVMTVAAERGTTAARLDNALWQFESTRVH